MPLSSGSDSFTRLRRTIFRAPGPLRWVAIGTLIGLVGIIVLVTVVVGNGLGSVPVVDARPPGSDGGNRGIAAAPLGVAPSPGTAPTPVPDTYVPLVVTAGKVCPEVPAARIAAQLMAASGFDPDVLGEDGAEGVAQFRPELWRVYTPSPTASPADPNQAVPALGRAMCALVDDFEQLDGDAYPIALAAFQWGTEAVRKAGGVPDAPTLRTFAEMVSDYTAYYEQDPRLDPRTATPTRRAPSSTNPNSNSNPSPTPGRTPTAVPTAPASNSTNASPARTSAAPSPTPVWQERVVRATTVLRRGQAWTSNRLRLTLADNGDVTLQDQGQTVWRTNTGGRGGELLVFQGDGNLVLYSRSGSTVWSTRTSGHNGATLVLRADGNVVILSNGRTLWQTGTAK
ncbi:hypothetical protein AB0J90_07420 [Micromonospora sp. NPDC049523]|uniref:hypothetical protein n=1 Tax=Micromonospora sp. NPDC049523 TaxID=3155921 RepID=UPI003436D389